MKKVKLFSFALAALMLGACSSEDVIDNGGQGTVLPGEKGYISLAINLPTTAGTRVSYDDGTPNEYDVKNAKLLIFSGENEADATCQGIYDLNISAFLDSPEDQITSTAQIVQEITKPETVQNLYALVVLNNNNIVTDAMKGQTFKSLYTTAKTLTVSNLNGEGFFMTNAPLYSKAGGTSDPTGGNVTTLATIDASKVCTTEAEALTSPAATVYVERALSKVTLNGSTNLSDGHNTNIASYEITGWTLDNTNKSTYLVRNVAPTTSWWAYQNGTKGYRFVDGSPVESGVSLYRTHFGIDPNYNTDYNADDYNLIDKNPENLTNADGTTPVYCLENTFDVAHMIEQYTTRVAIAAKLTVTGAEETGDFYLLNKNTSVIYTKDGVLDEVKRLWMNYFETVKSTYIKSGTFTKNEVAVTLGNVDKGGFANVASVVMSEPATDVTYQDGQSLETLNAAAATYVSTINDMLTIAYYKGGVAYYTKLIQHFGDTETPWDGTVGYGSNENNWLGRYGVLRNTWYDMTVTGLKNIGSPEVPDVTTDYDDPGDQYISVEINILPWAVRTQNVEL